MFEVIFTISLLLFSLLVYIVWVKPIKQMKRYTKLIRDRGYKVLQLPYNPLQIHLAKTIELGKKKGDPMILYKQDFQGYDVLVGNYFIWPQLEFMHPDFIKDFYAVDKHYQYPKQDKLKAIFTRIGLGVIFSEGKVWKKRRSILNKVFNFDFIKSLAGRICLICDQSIDKMEKLSKNNDLQKSVSYGILDLNSKIFSEVVLTTFLGSTKDQLIDNQPAGQFMIKLMAGITYQLLNPIELLLGPKFLNLGLIQRHRKINNRIINFQKWGCQFVDKKVKQIEKSLEVIQDLSKIEPKNIIEALILQKKTHKSIKENEQQLFNITFQEIFSEMSAFVAAGTDTTSHFTQMMIYQIVLNPEIEAKVRQQIQKYMDNDDFSFQNLKNFKYIDNIQKQTTRFYGPATHIFIRNTKVDNYLNELPILKDTSISIMHVVNHYSQKYFKNPKQFYPERWEDTESNNIPPFVTGGFSAGGRICIGKNLALLQNKIAIIKFFKRYKKIVLPNPNFKMEYNFLYSPEYFQTKLFYQ